MFNKTLFASTLMTAIIGAAVCACHSDEAAQPQPLVDPAASLQISSPRPSSFVGTMPASRIDERAITPTETVGAAAN
jgi:hypothetical protein